jgi:hypothetical protein
MVQCLKILRKNFGIHEYGGSQLRQIKIFIFKTRRSALFSAPWSDFPSRGIIVESRRLLILPIEPPPPISIRDVRNSLASMRFSTAVVTILRDDDDNDYLWPVVNPILVTSFGRARGRRGPQMNLFINDNFFFSVPSFVGPSLYFGFNKTRDDGRTTQPE